MKDMTLVFSMISGELFYIYDDEVPALEDYNIVLKDTPSSSCKQCYGRFHVGYETTGKYYVPCPRCMRKYSVLGAEHKVKLAVKSNKTQKTPDELITGSDKKDILDYTHEE